MVFKRRDRRPIWQAVADFFYPKGGWSRAFRYIQHRLHRLPDPPHKIARGLFAGVFTSFSPIFGMHFVIAIVLAKLMRGNMAAALLGTFFGNPVTFPIIAPLSIKLGQWMLGRPPGHPENGHLMAKFANAGREISYNFWAMFSEDKVHWSQFDGFYHSIFLPYLIGGLIPGIISGLVVYYLSVPLIAVYQKRRRGRLKKKLDELRRKAAKKADGAV